MAVLSLIGLFPHRGPSDGLPQAVPGRRPGAAVVDRRVVVGVGGGGVDALVVSVRAQQVVVVVVELGMMDVVLLLGLHVLEHGRGGGERRGCEWRRQRGERRERRYRGGQRGRWGFGIGVGEVVVLVVQVVVVVLAKVSVRDVWGAAVHMVHVHDVRLAVLRVVVEHGG